MSPVASHVGTDHCPSASLIQLSKLKYFHEIFQLTGVPPGTARGVSMRMIIEKNGKMGIQNR